MNSSQTINLYCLLIFATLFFIGCDQNSTKPENKVEPKEQESFNKIVNIEDKLYESIVYYDQLIVVGDNLIYILNTHQDIIEKTTVIQNLKFPVILSNEVFVEITEQNKIYITPNSDPNLGSPDPRLQLSLYTISADLDLSIPPSNLNGTVNNRHQVLLPIIKDSEVQLLMLNLVLSTMPFYTKVELDTFKIIDSEYSLSGIIKIEAYKDKFFISTHTENFSVESSGKINPLGIDISEGEIIDFFQHGNEIYLKTLKNKIYKSIDDGLSWNHVIDQKEDGYINHIFINDRLIAYSYLNIVEIDLSSGAIKTIDRTGIEGQIAFLMEFYNNIYVTTNTGLYYKTKDSFFTE